MCNFAIPMVAETEAESLLGAAAISHTGEQKAGLSLKATSLVRKVRATRGTPLLNGKQAVRLD